MGSSNAQESVFKVVDEILVGLEDERLEILETITHADYRGFRCRYKALQFVVGKLIKGSDHCILIGGERFDSDSESLKKLFQEATEESESVLREMEEARTSDHNPSYISEIKKLS